jgi:hypothetical protein
MAESTPNLLAAIRRHGGEEVCVYGTFGENEAI